MTVHVQLVHCCFFSDELQVCCGNNKADGRFINVTLPSLAALSAFQSVNTLLPPDPANFALRLLSIFFSPEQLARSNCTKADGRDLLDPTILLAIKRNVNVNLFFS